jgi:hypothetical protein
MAGDLPIDEGVVLTEAAEPDLGEALGSLVLREGREQSPGQVLHSYGRVKIIDTPPGGIRTSLAQEAGARGLWSRSAEAPPDITADLDPTERLGLAALRMRESDGYAQAKLHRVGQSEPWNIEGGCERYGSPEAGLYTTDRDVSTRSPEAGAPEAGAPGPTSARMEGTTAVGIIIVSGPNANLKFSDEERTKVVAEVQNGLSWLASATPELIGNIFKPRFSYDIHHVSIDRQPDSEQDDLEALWRDPVMGALGFSKSWQGVLDYVESIRQKLGTNWTYCGFFTKYPIDHFAYARPGGPRIVMQYSNDGWGPDNIDRVFAHETGHIFGAPDEYAVAKCDCAGTWGRWGRPNLNCVLCAPGGGVQCIMKNNDWTLCPYTLGHWSVSFTPLVAKHSGRALDIAGASKNHAARLQQFDWNTGKHQRFFFWPSDRVPGHYSLMLLHSAKVLDVAGASKANGAPVQQWDLHGGDNQLFKPEPLGDGTYRLVARHSGQVLDVAGVSKSNGAPVNQWPWNGGDNQRWRLTGGF